MTLDAEKITIPTTVILLGATGDLAQKKLLISFFHLHQKGLLPDNFHILGVSKDAYTNETYRAFAREQLEKRGAENTELIDVFLNTISYISGMFNETETFDAIKQHVEQYEKTIGMCTGKLFYIATHPRLYETVFDKIAKVRLETPCDDGIGWTRVLVEKPFGKDLQNAQHLDTKLARLFKEKQIYRIDHYLAKNALRDILSFRFSNIFFENRWNKKYINSITIRAHEAFGLENRGAFFDGVGALRDVGQNHILQMLALIGMEYPRDMSPEAIRRERARVLEHLVLPSKKSTKSDPSIVKGQYTTYKTIPDVPENSCTETYFAIQTNIRNARWRGVPFYLEHGKGLEKNTVEIIVRFRESHHCIRSTEDDTQENEYANIVHFIISPHEEITVRFWARNPKESNKLEPRDFAFLKKEDSKQADALVRNGYEAVLFDALTGDQTLFVSNREQTAQWRFVTRILEKWEGECPLPYAKGSNGPDAPLVRTIQKNANY